MKKRFNKFCSLLLTFAVTATTVLSSEGMLLTTYADDTVEVVEYAAEDEAVVEAATEEVAIEEEAIPAEEVEAVEEVVEEAPVEDADSGLNPGISVNYDKVEYGYDFEENAGKVYFDVVDIFDTVSLNAVALRDDDTDVTDSSVTTTIVGLEDGVVEVNAVYDGVDYHGSWIKLSYGNDEDYTFDGAHVCFNTYKDYIGDDSPSDNSLDKVEGVNENSAKDDKGIVVSFRNEYNNEGISDVYGYVTKEDKNGRGIQGIDTTADDFGTYWYTGKAIKPVVNVYDGRKLLTAGKDYSIKYRNNKDVAIGAVVKDGNSTWDSNGPTKTPEAKAPYVEITLKGAYNKGITVKKYFDIQPAEVYEQYYDYYDDDFNYDRKTVSAYLKNNVIVKGKKIAPVVDVYGNYKWTDKKGYKPTKTTLKPYTDYVVKYAKVSGNETPKAEDYKVADKNTKFDEPGNYYVGFYSVSLDKAPKAVCSYDRAYDGETGKCGYTFDDEIASYVVLTVLDTKKDLRKATVALSSNTVNFADEVVGGADDTGWLDDKAKATALVKDVKINGISVSFDKVDLKKTVGKITSIDIYPTAEWMKANPDYYIPGKLSYFTAKTNLKMTAIADIGKSKTTFVMKENTVSVDQAAKVVKFAEDYKKDGKSVYKRLTNESIYNYAYRISGSIKSVSINGVSANTTASCMTFTPVKACNDILGTQKVTIVGNAYYGYTGKINATYTVNVGNCKVDDVMKADVNPNTNTNTFKPFKDAQVSINDLSYSKKLAPSIKLGYVGSGSAIDDKAAKKLYSIKYTYADNKTKVGKVTADITFKGALKPLGTAKVNFEVVPVSINSKEFSIDASDVKVKVNQTLTAKQAAKKVKVTVAEGKIKYAAKKDYTVSANIYTYAGGDKYVSVSDNATLSANEVYYVLVTTTEATNPGTCTGYKTVDGKRVATYGENIAVPFKVAPTIAGIKVVSSNIYYKGDVNYLEQKTADKAGNIVLKNIESETGLVYGVDYYIDWDAFIKDKNNNGIYDEYIAYYGTPGVKKLKVVAIQNNTKGVSGSCVVTFKVEKRTAKTDPYKNVLTK